jgi:hypothetical protein
MILGCGKMRAHYRTPKPGYVENGGFSGYRQCRSVERPGEAFDRELRALGKGIAPFQKK